MVWLGLGGSGCGRRSSIRRLLRYPAYGYPAYGYPAYGYGIVSYRVPAGYAGYGPTPPSYVGQSYGFVSPSYGYAYASPYYRTYRPAHR